MLLVQYCTGVAPRSLDSTYLYPTPSDMSHSIGGTLKDNPCPIDKGFVYLVTLGNWTGEFCEKWELVFQTGALRSADQQLVTGISMLIAGFVQLPAPRNISTYHWEVLINLIWFASTTHLCTLTVLRHYFVHHTVSRSLRVILMVTMGLMMVAAIAPFGLYELNEDLTGFFPLHEIPVRCWYQMLPLLDSIITRNSHYRAQKERLDPRTDTASGNAQYGG